jgi:predicted short-subunit dehydrogenase-like oxidoreductase (DUF2520 family)
MASSKPKPKHNTEITIIGAGTLATALAGSLHNHGFRVVEIVYHAGSPLLGRAHALAKKVRARPVVLADARFTGKLVWICVPDDAISDVAHQIVSRADWRHKVVVHSSGALASDVLWPLKHAGAEVASAHPLMTFVNLPAPNFKNVPFAIEGDRKALTMIAAIVSILGSKPFRIDKQFKAAYHVFGFFSSPALIALLAAAQHVGALAGLDEKRSRQLMKAIVRQTINNCFRSSPQEAFSGPLRRGDVATIRKHLEILKHEPNLLGLYRSLCRIALQQLPVSHANELKKLIG